jgi:chemotaxis protein methyltransferase CheR
MALSMASFEYVRTLLRQRSAHVLEDDKIYLVETRLLPLARRQGLESVEELVLHLRARSNETLLVEVVEAMTINETCFFRDAHAFDALRHAVIPELIQRRAGVRTLNIWSAACSSGQEPYSLAILLRHYFPHLTAWKIRLLASDLSTTMLERSVRGRYSNLEVSRGLPPEFLEIYFRKEGDGWQVRDDIRRMVEFCQINLRDSWPKLPLADLVLMRNVLIYFDLPTKAQILRRVRRVIHSEGYLMLGGAETTHKVDDAFLPVSFRQVSLYRLREAPREVSAF